MGEITINRVEKRAVIRTGHTWYCVSLAWLISNAAYHPLFEKAARMLGWEPEIIQRVSVES